MEGGAFWGVKKNNTKKVGMGGSCRRPCQKKTVVIGGAEIPFGAAHRAGIQNMCAQTQRDVTYTFILTHTHTHTHMADG